MAPRTALPVKYVRAVSCTRAKRRPATCTSNVLSPRRHACVSSSSSSSSSSPKLTRSSSSSYASSSTRASAGVSVARRLSSTQRAGALVAGALSHAGVHTTCNGKRTRTSRPLLHGGGEEEKSDENSPGRGGDIVWTLTTRAYSLRTTAPSKLGGNVGGSMQLNRILQRRRAAAGPQLGV